MTTVKVTKEYIEVKGHSGYDIAGRDIVCAGISVLIQATYNYMKVTGNRVAKEVMDGYYKITIEELGEYGKGIIEQFKKMVKDMEKEYGRYIKGEYDENIR